MKKMTRKARPLFKSSATPSAGTGAPSSASTSSSSGGGGGILRRTTWADKIRDKLPPLEENEYEVLWERGVLGVIFLESERDGIPYVSKATETCISPEVQPGDTLKFVNIVRSKDHSFSDFFKILATMKKPVLLRFERANAGTPTSDDEVGAVPHPGFDQRSISSTSLGSTSSPDSLRGSKYQRAKSVPPNDQKPPKSSHSRGAFWRSSSGRDSTIPPPSNANAHPSPAPRGGDDGIYRVTRDHEVSPQQKPGGSARTPLEPTFQDYEVYWETGSLGLFFGEDRLTNLPVVTRSTSSANAVVQRMVAVNDTLVSANNIQSRDYTFDAFFSRLQQMNKPVRLVFRRPRREASPGKMAPGRKPSVTVDTNLSPGGANLHHRQLNGGDSPVSGRADTPPLPPSPQVSVALNQPSSREGERSRTLSPQSPFTASTASPNAASHQPTADPNGTARKSTPVSSSSLSGASPNGLDGTRQPSSSPSNGWVGSRSTVQVLKDDPYDRLSVRASERRGRSARGNPDTNFRLSSNSSPQHSDVASWAPAGPSPTIYTVLDDNVPAANTPPHTKPRPSPIETDSYMDLFGSPTPAIPDQVSPTNVEQGPNIAVAKPPSPPPPVKPASPVPPPSLASPAKPATTATPPSLASPTTHSASPAKTTLPVSPGKSEPPSDIWSMAAEEAAEDSTDMLSTSPEAERADPVLDKQESVEQSKPGVTSPRFAKDDVPAGTTVEGVGTWGGDSLIEDASIVEEQDVVDADLVKVEMTVSANDNGASGLPIPGHLSSDPEPDDIYTGEIAEVQVGLVVNAVDDYQPRDEVDVVSDGFGDEDKKQPGSLGIEMDSISIEGAPARLADGARIDGNDEMGFPAVVSLGASSIGVDSTSDDPIDDDSEGLVPLVPDPDITSDVDVVSADLMGNASKVKGDASNLSKASKPVLNANLAKYKKKGKSSRGVAKLPALGESEALTVPLVAPNAVNTTVQVRGRPKPKQTMMDTPDGATYLVKWKENRSIGLQLKEVRLAKGVFPLVTDVCQLPCCEGLKHVCIGDVIVEINGKNTSSMGVKKTVSFLKSCSKTTLLKLRHGPSFVSQRVSAYI